VVEEVPVYNLYGKNVVITGGSSGIGKAIAKSLARLGCDITIVARNRDVLETAVNEIKYARKSESVYIAGVAADVTDRFALAEVLQQAAARHQGTIDILITSAGISKPGRCLDVSDDDYEKVMRVNYMGTLHAIRAAIPLMKNGGRIMLVGSMAGLAGVAGLSAYCASKFAIRGLAESLQMELKKHRILVSCLAPPDVDTPMYREEMKSKPHETIEISKGPGLFQPEAVALDAVSALQEYRFLVTTGLQGHLQGVLTVGMAPCTSMRQIVLEFFCVGLFRLIGLFHLKKFNSIVLNAPGRVGMDHRASFSSSYHAPAPAPAPAPDQISFQGSFTSFSYTDPNHKPL
jgi:3-dehydrosphinganine reductase